MEFDLKTYCELFYSSHFVPITLYEGTKVIAFYSSLDKSLNLSTRVISHITSAINNPDIFSIPHEGQYSLIRVNGSNYSIVIGPVFFYRVTKDIVRSVASSNFIKDEELSSLENFLCSIPMYTYNKFQYLITYLHYSLNHEKLDFLEHFYKGNDTSKEQIEVAYTKKSCQSKEKEEAHSTYEFENLLLSSIQDGEIEKLHRFLVKSNNTAGLKEGVLADTPLRQAKNIFLGLVAMVGKVGGIRGGMDVEEAYQLIDLYSQECERASTVDAVKKLQYNMIIDFTRRVADSKVANYETKEIGLAMQYIRNHTNASIGIDDVASHIEKSRAWLTKHFRQECGMSVNDFIIQSKIKDAKRLLRYTDEDMIEISNYLCFSSQSYFQTVFKKITGMTPKEYRKKPNEAPV